MNRLLLAAAAIATASALDATAAPDWATDPGARDRDEGAAPCDWRELHVRAQGDAIQLAYRCSTNINFALGAAYSVYIDTDGNRQTGYRGSDDQFPIGADYLLQGFTLYRYNADMSDLRGTEWSWASLGQVPNTVTADWAEFTLPADLFRVSADALLFLLVGDNTASNIGGNLNDLMPDDAMAGAGRDGAIRFRLPKTE